MGTRWQHGPGHVSIEYNPLILMIILVLEKIQYILKKRSTHVMFNLYVVVPEHHLDRKTTGKEQRFLSLSIL